MDQNWHNSYGIAILSLIGIDLLCAGIAGWYFAKYGPRHPSMDEFDPRETIAALNPRAVDQSRVVVQMGEVSDLAREVSLKLSRCSHQASLLARIKYADMQSLRHNLHAEIMYVFRSIAHIHPYQLSQFADLVIKEAVNNTACRWCRGVTWFPETDYAGRETGKHIECDGCAGRGHHQFTDVERCERLGISKNDWRIKYKAHYHSMLDLVWEWDRQVKEAMAG